jgi:predicted dehydrogenase
MAKLKIACLGVGDVAQRDYLPELHRLGERAELVAVCSRTEARARIVAEQYGVTAWYTDYERMLAESEADIVLNLTPIQLHPETTIAALQAGKHVYSEKPLATSVRDAERIRAEAQQRELVVVSAPCVMIFPQVRYTQFLLKEGAVGEVYSARGHGHGGVPPWRGFMSDPTPYFAKGGGPAMDMAVYPLHTLTGLLGPVKRVSALAGHVIKSFVVEDGPAQGKEIPVEVDDNWHILLDFGDSRLASLTANNCAHGTRSPQLELWGLQGTVAVNLLDMSAPVEVLRPGVGWEQVSPPFRAGWPPPRQNGPDHYLGIEHLVDCIQHQQKPILSVDHALHVIEILEKAALSAAEGRVVEIESREEMQ